MNNPFENNLSIRFLRLAPGTKRPIGTNWNDPKSGTNYSWDELQKARQPNEGVGVLCGSGDPPLLIVDIDAASPLRTEIQKTVMDLLPETYMVKTPNNGVHNYFYCPDIQKMQKVYLPLLHKGGEIRGQYCNVAIAPTEVNGKTYVPINNKAIAQISIEAILTALAKFIPKTKEQATTETNGTELNILDFCDISQLKRHGNEYYGAHPIHGSEHEPPMNFWVNPTTNQWHCFRCNSGGGPIQWLAVREKKIECHEAQRGALRGDRFIEVAKIAEKETGKSILTKKTKVAIQEEEAENWRGVVRGFVESHGVFYDDHKLWWMWNTESQCYKMTDETNIFNALDQALEFEENTYSFGKKGMIVELIRREARFNKPTELPWHQIQFKDTIIDFTTGERFNASRQFFTVNPIPWKLGESEDTPTIEKLFSDWVEPKHVLSLYEILAFSLARHYFIQRAVCFVGGGANGKSKYWEILDKFLGAHNQTTSSLGDIEKNRFEGSKLYKKLVCKISETEYSMFRKTSLFKQLTGEDMIRIEFKGQNPFDDTNYAKLLISTNSVPPTPDKTFGFFRRWFIIDFPNQFTEKARLIETIPDIEFENLALKSVRLLKELYQNARFTNEASAAEREQIYETHSNPIIKFINDECVRGADQSQPFYEFYSALEAWLKSRNKRLMSRYEVSKILQAEGAEIRTEKFKKSDGTDSTWRVIWGFRVKQGQLQLGDC